MKAVKEVHTAKKNLEACVNNVCSSYLSWISSVRMLVIVLLAWGLQLGELFNSKASGGFSWKSPLGNQAKLVV